MKKVTQTHAELVMQILAYLTRRGIVAGKIKTMGDIIKYKNKWGTIKWGRRKDPWIFQGFADIFWFYPEKIQHGVIEVKAGKDQLSDTQKRFRDLALKTKLNYCLARDLDDVVTYFKLGDIIKYKNNMYLI